MDVLIAIIAMAAFARLAIWLARATPSESSRSDLPPRDERRHILWVYGGTGLSLFLAFQPFFRLLNWLTYRYAKPIDLIPNLLLGSEAVLVLIGSSLLYRKHRAWKWLLSIGVTLLVSFVAVFYVPIWIMASNADSPDEEVRVAEAYREIDLPLPNFWAAARWYLRAAEHGHVEAQFTIGFWYARGIGVSEDDKKAHFWIQKAAANGHEDATRFLQDDPESW